MQNKNNFLLNQFLKICAAIANAEIAAAAIALRINALNIDVALHFVVNVDIQINY